MRAHGNKHIESGININMLVTFFMMVLSHQFHLVANILESYQHILMKTQTRARVPICTDIAHHMGLQSSGLEVCMIRRYRVQVDTH